MEWIVIAEEDSRALLLSRYIIIFIKAPGLILELFKEGMMKLLGVTEAQIQAVVDYVVSALPGYLQRSLSAANNLKQTA